MRMYTKCQDPTWEVGNPDPARPSPREERNVGEAAPEGLPTPGALLSLRSRALDSIAEGVVLVALSDPRHAIVYANPAFERWTGYAVGEVVGRSWELLPGVHGNPATSAAIAAALQDRRDWSGEVSTTRGDGTAAWYELRIIPMPEENGAVRYALISAVDVTDRRQFQEGLRQAQKMAAVGWLAGGLAHDFNNLLTPILGYCDLLLAAAPPIPVRDGLLEIRKAGEWGTALVGQLHAIARQQKSQPQVVKVLDLVAAIGSLLQCLIPRNVTLVTHMAPDLNPIEAGPGQAEQVLLNLIRNACDAMPQGGTVTVTAANTERGAGPDAAGGVPPGSYVVLTVADTGQGMTEEVRAHLFQPLFSTKEDGKGSGLGLFMVHNIVRENGGSIIVTSTPGRGTRVEIYWPAAHDTGARGTPARAPERPSAATILLVDDEPGVRDVVRRRLRQEGYTVLEAATGQEALTIAQEHLGPIHLLLTDVAMPQMNAFELVARLAPRRPDMKVVYFSGDCPEEAGDFLPKPFHPDAMVRKVREVLGR